MPSWSSEIPLKYRNISPFLGGSFDAHFNASHPKSIYLNGTLAEVYLSNSPIDVSGKNRSWHLDSILDLIVHAKKYVYLSVMDFIPRSIYNNKNLQWNALSEALMSAYQTRGVEIKILVSEWAHTKKIMLPLLKNLYAQSQICDQCRGSFEIRVINIPGWDRTLPPKPQYPKFSRVNHPKFTLTDQGVDIGTSNYTWGYFYNTAGASIHIENSEVVDEIKEIFLRDWNSSYSRDLKP